MNTEEVADDVIRSLRRFTNPERQAHTRLYFPSAMENLGVAVPDIRRVVRTIRKRVKAETPRTVLDLADAILASNTLEGRQAAHEIIAGHPETMAAMRLRDLERIGKGMDNWTSVDSFSSTLAGQSWRGGRISDAAVKRWARSRDRWWRRAALVATIPLNMSSRGGTGDAPRTLTIAGMLVSDHDDMVVKGLSWALRALVPVDPDAVRQFLEDHDEEIHPRARREVRNRLTTGKKSGG